MQMTRSASSLAFFLYPVGGTLQPADRDAAGPLTGGKVLALDAAVILLAAAHDGQRRDLIGGARRLANCAPSDVFGAAVGKRLMHRDTAPGDQPISLAVASVAASSVG